MQDRYPEGHWMSIGILVGVALGTILALAGILLVKMSFLVGIAPVLGLSLGIAIGAALERRHKDELRPLTGEERQLRSRLTLVGLGALGLVLLALFVVGSVLLLTGR